VAIRCITFDLDDTLWEVGPVILRAEQEFYGWLAARCPRIAARFDLPALTAHRRSWMRRFPERGHDLTGLRKQWLAHLLAEHGDDEICVEEAFRVFWEHRNAVELFEEAPGTLERLRGRFTVGVITNGNACVHHIGIGHWFDFVVSSERAGHSKPAPEIFHAALAEAGVDAGAAAHVGDDPTNDVLGASGVGMRAVWYNPALRPWPGGRSPDAVIRSLGELHGVLARM